MDGEGSKNRWLVENIKIMYTRMMANKSYVWFVSDKSDRRISISCKYGWWWTNHTSGYIGCRWDSAKTTPEKKQNIFKKCFQCFWFQILRDNDSLPKKQGHAVSWKLFGGEECSEQGLKDQCKMYLMFVMFVTFVMFVYLTLVMFVTFVYLMFVKVQFEASEDSPTSDNASLSSRWSSGFAKKKTVLILNHISQRSVWCERL